MIPLANNYVFTTGLKQLCKLETLSLAHNVLDDAAFRSGCPLDNLVALKKLDLSRNLLTCVPLIVGNLKWYDNVLVCIVTSLNYIVPSSSLQ